MHTRIQKAARSARHGDSSSQAQTQQLIEAKVQQQQHLPTTRHPSSNTPSKAWEYAQTKIDQQQERVNTLKLVLKEQKRLFGKKDHH